MCVVTIVLYNFLSNKSRIKTYEYYNIVLAPLNFTITAFAPSWWNSGWNPEGIYPEATMTLKIKVRIVINEFPPYLKCSGWISSDPVALLSFKGEDYMYLHHFIRWKVYKFLKRNILYPLWTYPSYISTEVGSAAIPLISPSNHPEQLWLVTGIQLSKKGIPLLPLVFVQQSSECRFSCFIVLHMWLKGAQGLPAAVQALYALLERWWACFSRTKMA